MRQLDSVQLRPVHYFTILLTLLCVLLGPVTPSHAVDADVLLRGGTIYDGTGSDGVVGDVAIQGERIVAVGNFEVGTATREIDCTGLVIAPGFIDLHTHCDGSIVKPATRNNLNYLTQGCTTVVTGNCGGGKGNVAEYLAEIDEKGAGTNIAHLIPQGNVRKAVLGNDLRPATPEEIAKMQGLIDEGMRAGAWGMSTGLIYAPGCHAKVDELAELAKRVSAHGGIYATHLRNEGDRLIEAIEEALEIGRRADIPVHISHFKSNGRPNWGHLKDAVARIEKAREKGLVVTADEYPYTAGATSLDAILLPHDRIPEGRYRVIERMKADPEFDKRIRELIRSQLSLTRTIALSACKTAKWRGRHLAEIAEAEDMDIVELVVKLHEQGGAKAVTFSMSEEDVLFGMAVPWVATASDGSGQVAKPGASFHPRSFGTFPRKIGRYALQREVIPLARAIRSCSGLPADILGLPERGYLREGMYADIVVLDPKTYIDRATFEEPGVHSTGLCYLFLAGKLAIDEGKPSEKLYGRALRHVSALASPLRFQRVVIDGKPPQNPWIKIVGDLNGDGKPDIIIGGSKGPLAWYRNPDWKKFVIADGGYNTVAGAAVDVDGDGDLDIALGGVVWFANPGPKGDPAAARWAAHQVDKRRGHDLLAADLDGDGKVDLVMRDQSAFGSKAGHSIFLYRQTTRDRWTMRELRCGEGEGIRVADLNGDGKPDIVIGGSWFENSGDVLKGPWTEHVFTTQWNYPHTKVAVGDLNGDGRPDVILAPAELKGGSHRIAWYEAPADAKAGGWKQHVVEEPVETVVHALAVADFDGDGKLDLAAARMHQGRSPREVAVYLNAGGGRSWQRQVIATTGSHDIVAADLNGDGRPDLLGANHGGSFQPVELWRNQGKRQ